MLGDAEKRKEYDQYLDSGLCVSYSTWKKHCLGKRAEVCFMENVNFFNLLFRLFIGEMVLKLWL